MIRILEKQVADKIAAGEVIERPVSIVKELVENALDAGSTSVTVEIKKGGKTYIRVTDNGCGIPRDEVETAFLRHATSKIITSKDLDSINTLGFRGEALASICAVTRTELITKCKDDKTGTNLVLHGGDVITKKQTGCPDGTTIIISDLFYNTPARLKFMKSDGAESGLIIEFVSQMALAYKDVKFRLINNGQILFSTSGDGNRINNLLRIYPDIDGKNMVPIKYTDNNISVDGYISTPAMSRPTRGSQIFFVNGRVIYSKVIERGITLGYKERLFSGRYPIAFLFIEVKPDTLDVNIHPNKREVRFDDDHFIMEIISQAIVNALGTKEAVPDAGNLFKTSFSQEEKEKDAKQIDIKSFLSNVYNPSIKSTIKENINLNISELKEDYIPSSFTEKENINIENINEENAKDINSKIEISEPTIKLFDFKDLTVTGVIFDTYITAVDEDSFYLIDQHAAHERIFYEKLVGIYQSEEKAAQQLMVPIIINVSPSIAADDGLILDSLKKMGFGISMFGENTYRLSQIPMFMELSEAEDFVNEFIDSIKTSTDIKNTVVVNKLIMMSCKAAVKANDKLSRNEVDTLISNLSLCKNPFSCPHGRPTFIKLRRYEIEKMFKRV